MKRAARLVALLGAVGVGSFLASASPEEVVLVYDLSGSPDATTLEVELREGDALVRRAEFSVGGGRQIRHELRLPQGQYGLAWRIAGAAGARRGEQTLEVEEEGTIVLPLGR